jgi:hypothetical protein
MSKNPTSEQITEIRTRFITESDPFAVFINDFLQDRLRLEAHIDNLTEAGYHHCYSILLRGHWLKRSIWIRKHHDSAYLYKSEAAYKASKRNA